MYFSFSEPLSIYICLCLIGLIIFVKKKYPVALPFLYTSVTKESSQYSFKSIISIVLPYLILFLISCLLARPSFVTQETTQTKQARQFVIALDISYSMNADDLTPSRLEVAKDTIKNLLNQFAWDQIGFVLFAGKPFASIPLSFDIEAIKDMISQYSTESINQQNPTLQGTAIGDAILASLSLLDNQKQWSSSLIKEVPKAEDFKSIILITDGSANVWVDPILATKYASTSWVTIYSIWVGSEAWWSIPIATAFATRRQSVEWVDTKTLSEIAKISWWSFARVTDEEELQQALKKIANIKPWEVIIKKINHYSQIQAYIFIILLILEIFLFFIMYSVTSIQESLNKLLQKN